MNESISTHQIGKSQVVIVSYPEAERPANRFFGAIVKETPLLRSPYLDSQEACQEFLKLVIGVDTLVKKGAARKEIRLSSMQLNTVQDEWNFVQRHNQSLFKLANDREINIQVAHLCFPTDYAYLRRDPLATSEFTLKAIKELQKQFNAEAWLHYCRWFYEEAEQVLRTFRPEDSEEYQLQGLLEDFGHEVNSSLLKNLLDDIKKGVFEEAASTESGERDALFALEKSLVASRKRLTPSLEIESDLLARIVTSIKTIEAVHPDLSTLRRQAELLHQLTADHLSYDTTNCFDWSKKLLLIQLLDDEFGVLPAICCDTGIERTNSVFSIRLALSRLKENFSFDERFRMCISWDSDKSVTSKIGRKLCQHVLENFHALNILFKKHGSKRSEGLQWGANSALLSFLPPSEDAFQKVPLIEYDKETDRIIGCTEAGIDLLDRLSVL